MCEKRGISNWYAPLFLLGPLLAASGHVIRIGN